MSIPLNSDPTHLVTMVLHVILLQRHVRTQIQTHNLLFLWYSPDHIMTLCPLFTVCVGGKSFSLHVSFSLSLSTTHAFSSMPVFVILFCFFYDVGGRERERRGGWLIHIYCTYGSGNGSVLPMDGNPSCFCFCSPLRWTEPLLMHHCTEEKPCTISLDCHYWIYWY